MMATPAQLARELETLTARIAKAQQDRAFLEGNLDAANRELKRLGCSSAEDAEKKAARLTDQADQLMEEVANGLSQLQEACSW